MTTTRLQLWCAWCGPAFIVVFFSGMLVADLLPPPKPSWSAQETADFWRQDPDLKHLGLVMMMASTTFLGPFTVVIFQQLRRIPEAGVMAYVQLVGGAIGVLGVVIPTIMLMAVSFRPERDPEITQAMQDLAFIPFVINWPPVVIQCIGLALAVLQDRRAAGERVLPRWLAFYSLWTAFLLLPGSLLLFFKTGVWAWTGLFSFWLVAALFGVFQLVVFAQVRKAIAQETQTA